MLRTTGMTHLRPIFHNARSIVCAEKHPLLFFLQPRSLVFFANLYLGNGVPSRDGIRKTRTSFNSEKTARGRIPLRRKLQLNNHARAHRSQCPACNANQPTSGPGFSIFILSSLPLSFQSPRLSELNLRNRILINYSAVGSRHFPGTPRMKNYSWGKNGSFSLTRFSNAHRFFVFSYIPSCTLSNLQRTPTSISTYAA